MSFGGFSFGASSSNAQAQPQAQAQGQGQTQSSVPSFSFTGPTPAATPPANTFSFGAPQNQASSGTNNTAPQAAGGLFGQPQQQQQPQSGGGGGGLFGSSGGTFGAKPAASSTQTAQGGLFGAASTPASTNTGTGGMFGQPQQQQQQQQQQQGGLFGSQSQQPQAQSQSTSTGLFGQQSQGASGSTSLFGSTNQNQNQSQPGSSLFASQAKPAQGLSFGQSTNASNTPSGSQGMTKGTKFTDLPEQHQKALEQLDAAFKQQKQMVYGTLDSQEDLGRAIGQVINDVKSAEAECTALEMGLAPLRRACEQLSLKVRSEEEDLQRLAEIWGSYRPTDGRPSSLRAGALRDFRKQYFRKVVADSEERIPRYKKTISELRRAVDSLGNTNDIPSAQAIAHTIQNHQNAIYTLAASVEGLEVRWNDVRDYYSQMYKDKTGSIRDPLDIAREQKGLPPVRT